ncbi:MAG: FAD-binding oxidoreductase [Candidatus Methanofastidiosia archaeon]
MMKTVFEEIIDRLGAKKVSTNPIDLYPYSRDWSPMEHDKDYLPEAVCIPSTTKEVSIILEIAQKWKIPVVAWGGGTGMGGSNLAVCGGIIIATKSMSNIIEIDKDNMTVTVQAGATIQSINGALEPLGLWFPHDPESKPTSTIGAALMCDSNGTFGIKYGSMVNYVLNATVVIPGGEVIHIGQRKAAASSSGYKLLWLMIGSEGTLGVMTELTLRIFPLPKKRDIMLWIAPSINDATQALYAIQASGICIESAHINDKHRLNYYTHAYREKTGKTADIPKGYNTLLALSVAGDDDVLKFSKRKISTVLCSNNCIPLENEDIVKGWWASKHTLSWEKNKWSSSQKKEKFGSADVSVPLGRLQDMYDAFIKYTKAYDLPKVGTAVYNIGPHISPSISFAVFVDDHDKEKVGNFFKYVEDMSKTAVLLGGTMSSFIGDGTRLRHLTPFEHGKCLKMMWKIKKLFDPDNILNPGKIFPENIEKLSYSDLEEKGAP